MAKVTIDTELPVRTFANHKETPLNRKLLCARCKYSRVADMRSPDDQGERMKYFECAHPFQNEVLWPVISCEQVISCSVFDYVGNVYE